MISRYSREQIAKIWQPENKYKIWLDIEIYAAEAMEKFKIIPKLKTLKGARIILYSTKQTKRPYKIKQKQKTSCQSITLKSSPSMR